MEVYTDHPLTRELLQLCRVLGVFWVSSKREMQTLITSAWLGHRVLPRRLMHLYQSVCCMNVSSLDNTRYLLDVVLRLELPPLKDGFIHISNKEGMKGGVVDNDKTKGVYTHFEHVVCSTFFYILHRIVIIFRDDLLSGSKVDLPRHRYKS